jgi:hypothetical protein
MTPCRLVNTDIWNTRPTFWGSILPGLGYVLMMIFYTQHGKNGKFLMTWYGGDPNGDVSSEVSYRLEQRRNRLKHIVNISDRHWKLGQSLQYYQVLHTRESIKRYAQLKTSAQRLGRAQYILKSTELYTAQNIPTSTRCYTQLRIF